MPPAARSALLPSFLGCSRHRTRPSLLRRLHPPATRLAGNTKARQIAGLSFSAVLEWLAVGHFFQQIEKLGKADRRRLRALNQRLAFRPQRSDAERHCDAMIAARIDRRRM